MKKQKIKEKILREMKEFYGNLQLTPLEENMLDLTIRETANQIFEDIDNFVTPDKINVILTTKEFKKLKKKWLK